MTVCVAISAHRFKPSQLQEWCAPVDSMQSPFVNPHADLASLGLEVPPAFTVGETLTCEQRSKSCRYAHHSNCARDLLRTVPRPRH